MPLGVFDGNIFDTQGAGTAETTIVTVNDVVRSALMEIRVGRAEQPASYSEAERGLELFNELRDLWNARTRAIYQLQIVTAQLVPGLATYQLGPPGTAAPPGILERPVGPPERVISAVRVVGGDQVTGQRVPLAIGDEQWYRGLVEPFRPGTPEGIFYTFTWPLGAVWVYPVPVVAEPMNLTMGRLLGPVQLTDVVDLPYGYRAALRLTLAEWCADSFGQKVSPSTAQRAREARATIFGANDRILTAHTRDAGMPGGCSGWNADTGEVG